MDTTIEQLGEPRIESPLRHVQFVDDDKRVLYSCSAEDVEQDICAGNKPVAFMKAGPRRKIFFDSSKLKSAIVTCGGLCPGLNNVIRSLVLTLYHTYGAKNILGIMYGFQGFIPKFKHPVMELTPETVS